MQHDAETVPTGADPADASTLNVPVESAADAAAAFERELTPGTVIAGRYRIVNLVGRGGMGAVYRADDLRLGEAVALKFLPFNMTQDERKLQRLYAEIRIGRRITHPNVCRTHDLVETEGQRFLSMQYVDGEDLQSLLSRIGRLPPTKALEVARDICAGLQAAHALGIIHRDLKPANVMLDGRGRAKLMDFGLADFADRGEGQAIAGTPAYMAPEQLAGESTTARTDVYALGLLLFEIFSGARIFNSSDVGRIVDLHRVPKPALSSLVPGNDPRIETLIAACLQEDPALRPADAQAVILALPGGEPWQEAAAAGETPSPEMVAAAQRVGEMSLGWAWVNFAAIVFLTAVAVYINGRASVGGSLALPNPPEVLEDRARQILKLAGVASGMDRASGFASDWAAIEHHRSAKRDVPPLAVKFWYRERPSPLVPGNRFSRVLFLDPPITTPGETLVDLDSEGRLVELRIVPRQFHEPEVSRSFDWMPLLQVTIAATAALKATDPKWTPPLACDERRAWETDPIPSIGRIRIEGASFLGKPVWLKVIYPWERPTAMRPRPLNLLGPVFAVLFFVLGLFAVITGRRNLRSGRGDRAGAKRLGVVVAILWLIEVLALAKHVASAGEVWLFSEAAAVALFFGSLFWIGYLAIEPSVRKRWPQVLIGWQRLLAGHLRDAMVGREILIGSAVGLVETVVDTAIFGYLTDFRVTGVASLYPISSVRAAIASLSGNLMNALLYGMGFLVGVVLLTSIFKRKWLAAAIWIAVVLVGWTPWSLGDVKVVVALAITVAVVTAARIALLWHAGHLALVASYVVPAMLGAFANSLDPTAWYFWQTVAGVTLVVALAAFSFRSALGRKPFFGRPITID